MVCVDANIPEATVQLVCDVCWKAGVPGRTTTSYNMSRSQAPTQLSIASFPGLPRLQFFYHLQYAKLQAIKNWSRGRPGNEASFPLLHEAILGW